MSGFEIFALYVCVCTLVIAWIYSVLDEMLGRKD